MSKKAEYQRKYRKTHPIRYAYNSLKHNAKRRGKVFDLSFDDFKKFVVKTKYMDRKGIYKDSYHIDRIDEFKGYTIDNIQILTNTENVKKYFTHGYNNDELEYQFRVRVVKKSNYKQGECPF